MREHVRDDPSLLGRAKLAVLALEPHDATRLDVHAQMSRHGAVAVGAEAAVLAREERHHHDDAAAGGPRPSRRRVLGRWCTAASPAAQVVMPHVRVPLEGRHVREEGQIARSAQPHPALECVLVRVVADVAG